MKRLSRKIIKILAITFGVIVALLVSFHFWFVNHAEDMIEEMVRSQSNGKLNLQVDKFKFNWFSKKMELRNARFFSTDTATAATGYRFRVDRLRIEVKAILPVIFEKKFLIDSIHVVNPDITVTRLRSVTDTTSKSDTTSLSIPQEMGKIYNSIQDALKVLQVNRFQIENGKFSLINKIRPYDEPVIITNLDFHLENLRVDTSKVVGEQKILFSDNVALHTSNQDIMFPDGRHRLSFSNFRINILKKLVEFDSCTILATKGDSSKSSFRIFFDKLMLTNIDFDTLYHSEVIKADSVYCINPRFRLDVDLEKRTGPVKPPKLNELIQQLTGNLEVAFVVVQNGSFDINTMREGRPSSFTSDHNNFELQGLRIKQDAPRPMTVEKFVMAIRNYENFLRDSTYAIQFDSVLINNNRINLNNFTYQKFENGRGLNKINVPQFELEGLAWDNLIIGQQLKADKVVLMHPVITYDLTRKPASAKRDVFQTLKSIGEVMELEDLDVIDGKINLVFRNNVRMELEHASLSVRARQLVQADRFTGIHRSVSNINFKRGKLFMNGATIALDNVQFSGNRNQLFAARAKILTRDNVNIDASDVKIQAINIGEKNGDMVVDGLSWGNATIDIPALPAKQNSGGNRLELRNMDGRNTRLNFHTEGRELTVFLKQLGAGNIISQAGKDLQIQGFAAAGERLIYKKGNTHIAVQSLNIRDRNSSVLNNVSYLQREGNDSVALDVPLMRILPDINALLAGRMELSEVALEKPTIAVSYNKVAGDKSARRQLPLFSIKKFSLSEPTINVSFAKDSQQTKFTWRGAENKNRLELGNVSVDREDGYFSIGSLSFLLDHFDFTSTKGKRFDAGKGQVSATLNNLKLHQTDLGDWDWQGLVSTLQAKDFIIDSIGKKNGTLLITSATLNNLSVNAGYLLNMREMVSNNKAFNLRNVTGQYVDTVSKYYWYNGGYDKLERRLEMDSFVYRPTPERDAFMAKQKFQADYLTASTGKVSIGPVDIARFTNDTILDLGVISIDSARMTSYRDQRLERQRGVIKELPVNLLKKIPVKLIADTLNVKNNEIVYEEYNAKTNAAGNITVSQLNAQVTRLRNFDLGPTDSLRIKASAWIEDAVHTQISVRESYTDTLSGFLMTAKMRGADLKRLNPVLGPLASVELVSGVLDSMSMRVAGREYLAFGDMQLHYHDLKIRVLRKGGTRKRPLLGPLADLLVNALVKNKNSTRTGKVFFERLRERSSVNYLVKITLSGITSSVGVRKNKKVIRKYKNKLDQKELPPVEGFDLSTD